MAAKWHPDRYSRDPVMKHFAEKKLINKSVWFMIKVAIQYIWVKLVWVVWMVLHSIWVVCSKVVKDLLIWAIYSKACLVVWEVEMSTLVLMDKIFLCSNLVMPNVAVNNHKDFHQWEEFHLIYLDNLDFDFVYSF